MSSIIINTENICNTFNAAFSDYVVPMHLTTSILEQKMKGENLQRDFSIGAFTGDTLGAFILHAPDNNEKPAVLYNGGTGVVPAYRGQHLVQKMYDQFIPVFQQQGIKKVILEVISTNLPAIKAYTNSGFHKTRIIHCFKGHVNTGKIAEGISIKENAAPEWNVLSTFLDMIPTWSNTTKSIQRETPFTGTWEAIIDGEVVGFISVNRDTRRIRSIAVRPDFRRRGVGNALLQHVSTELNGQMSIINIDEKFPEIGSFLKQAGLEHYLSQYEMSLEI
jgi:ribosomal protein S18 acetylase RimI-like enzyme